MNTARAVVMGIALAIPCGCAASDAEQTVHPTTAHATWAMYQHSPDRNAVFGGYTLPRDWSFQSQGKINSGLALVGGEVLFTTFSHKVIALDVTTGQRLWRSAVPNIAMSTPIVAGNSVFVGTGDNGVLDRTWNPILKIQFAGKDVWGVPAGDEIAAFNLKTGAPLWTHHTVGEDMPSPVYDGGRVIFANGDWHAYALRADTGQELWSTDLGGVATMASAVTAGNAVVVSVCTHGMRQTSTLALDPAGGKILWRAPFGHCDASPAYADGKVFLSSVAPGDTDLQGRTVVAALDARTGKPLWVYRAKQQGLWSIVGSSEAAVAGAYAGGTYYQSAPFDDEMLAFDGSTGKVDWRYRTSGPVKMSPVIAGGRVYFGDTAGLFYTLNARTGALVELREFHAPFSVTPPIIAGNKILIVNGNFVNAMPLTGKPTVPKGIGWALVPAKSQTQRMAESNAPY